MGKYEGVLSLWIKANAKCIHVLVGLNHYHSDWIDWMKSRLILLKGGTLCIYLMFLPIKVFKGVIDCKTEFTLS